MTGKEIKEWRKRNKYSQAQLQSELGLKSRSTISSLENQETQVPRSIELALAALEICPMLRSSFGIAQGNDQRSTEYPGLSLEDVRKLYVRAKNPYSA